MPLRLIRGVHPLVRVTINDGRKLDLLVDTGANRTVLPPQVFGETYGQKIIHIEKLCFENGACFEDAAVSVVPTNYSQSRRGYYNGLLGFDLLQYTRLTIDYKNRRMFLAAGDGGTSGRAVIHSPFVRDQKTWRPHGTMSVRGAGFANILLDTGASMTRLTPSMLRRLETMPATAYLEMAFSATGVQGTEILSLRDVCINRQACVSEMLGQKASWAAVGCSFFRHFQTTFDFRQRRLTLRPYGPSWTPPKSALQRLGLQLDIIHAERIVWVQMDSPAAVAGIEIDARLVQIIGRPIGELGYLGAHEIFENPALHSIDLLLRDVDGKVRKIQLIPRAP